MLRKGDFVIVTRTSDKKKQNICVEVDLVERFIFQDTAGHIHFKKDVREICPIHIGDIVVTKLGEEEVLDILKEYSFPKHAHDIGALVIKTNSNSYKLQDISIYKKVFIRGRFKTTKTVYIEI